ncbi:HpcH/HpaI aldolase/citrate lyase family protein [Clostridium nigeriense]|uniref:HpcH/HpaI aldolase/citrate lyase family protein n=1 Tax=Clostridium nigeriense TaxID=1805470 RepID=UPI003D347A30
MRHLKSISNDKFFKEPLDFNKYTNKDLLKYAVGSNLYMNALMDIYSKIKLEKIKDTCTITICFEDSIKESDVEVGEENVLDSLEKLSYDLINGDISKNILPLIFIRVRSVSHFINFSSKLSKGQLKIITGFIFPKFNKKNGAYYLGHLEAIENEFAEKIYGMPILESEEIVYKENRTQEILYLKELIDRYKDSILNIRVGGTDFSSKFGLRRSVSRSIYDIGVINDCLCDIVNIFGRCKEDYIVSAPVWEYFSSGINSKEVKGLIREIELDKENGFCGKTIIHPTQGIYVNSLYSVEYEDYIDAINILNNSELGGVFKGYSNNKMNEISPHYNWAKRIGNRAKIFGVLNKEISYYDLFSKVGSKIED